MVGSELDDGEVVEGMLEARLAQLTPDEQHTILVEALDLLTVEEQRAVLAQVAEALTLSGHTDDAALLGLALRMHDSGYANPEFDA
jgi:hypothetical protein